MSLKRVRGKFIVFEREGILHCLVETITKEQCFDKCVYVTETIELTFGDGVYPGDGLLPSLLHYDTTEFRIIAVPFNLVVVEPSVGGPPV